MITGPATVVAPTIDYSGLAPFFAVFGGAVAVLMLGLIKGERVQRVAVPSLAVLALLAAGDRVIRLWDEKRLIMEGALQVDSFSLAIMGIVLIAALVTVLYSVNHPAVKLSRSGEYHSLLLGSVGGMMVLASAQNIVTFFLGLELLSIPLYVLSGSLLVRRSSLESGLKYLIIGSVGSATLLYGLAFIYGATGYTDLPAIGAEIAESAKVSGSPILLVGVALVATGLAFKASVAPFHQWTPDVYQGAPTPITAFMAVATKAAAMAAIARIFVGTFPGIEDIWQPALAALAVVTIVVGNVGAIGQDSLKRMLAYSGVAQAGYMLAAVVVGTKLGTQSLVFYLFAYLLMNLAAFGVIVAREHESRLGDHIDSLKGLGQSDPLKATVMAVAMLSLAGFPATVGFVGKFYLIRATVEGGFTWLAVAIVVGTMISLLYYLRVVAVMWLQGRGSESDAAEGAQMPAIAGGAPEATAGNAPESTADTAPAATARARMSPRKLPYIATATLLGAATLFFGIIPEPVVKIARQAGSALGLG